MSSLQHVPLRWSAALHWGYSENYRCMRERAECLEIFGNQLLVVREVNMPSQLERYFRGVLSILRLATNKYSRMDGTQCAAAFSHYAFFSLFPLIVLCVTIASVFIDKNRAATQVMAYVEAYIPISGGMQSHIVETISGVVRARRQAGLVALVMLVLVAMQFFATLIRATNCAWDVQAYRWWRLPLKSLVFLAILVGAILIGIAVPVLAKMAKDSLFPGNQVSSWIYSLGSFFIPLLVVFLGLSLFYRMAPRRPTHFSEVWVGALCATILLQAAEILFVIYLKNFATLNAVYGAFGGIMALLLWIYLSGSILIFGACLCAAQAEARSTPADARTARRTGGIEA